MSVFFRLHNVPPIEKCFVFVFDFMDDPHRTDKVSKAVLRRRAIYQSVVDISLRMAVASSSLPVGTTSTIVSAGPQIPR